MDQFNAEGPAFIPRSVVTITLEVVHSYARLSSAARAVFGGKQLNGEGLCHISPCK
jgi:hypothetical protein